MRQPIAREDVWSMWSIVSKLRRERTHPPGFRGGPGERGWGRERDRERDRDRYPDAESDPDAATDSDAATDPDAAEAPSSGFQESMTEGLPPAVRRWFLHAIRPGTPLATHADLVLSGALRWDRDQEWRAFHARESIAPPHRLAWSAWVQRGLLWTLEEERYALGAGTARRALYGFISGRGREGPDLSRSLLGRLILESIWLPATLLPQRGVVWEQNGEDSIRAQHTLRTGATVLDLRVEPDGRLLEASMDRWGPDPAGIWQTMRFGMRVEDECPFAGFTIPSEFSAGWGYGTSDYQESVRLRVDGISFS
jgi:hypothetical protein